MSLDHLDILNQQMPELFSPRDLPPFWDDNYIIIPVNDPEAISFGETGVLAETPADLFATDFVGTEESNIENYANLIVPGAPLGDLYPGIVELFGGSHGGAPVAHTDRTRMPPPDCLAFYLPFHYYHPNWWGIYLLLEGVHLLAGEIIWRSGGAVSHSKAMEAARLFLYYHEAFHHKTECFATRLELTHRQPLYKKGFETLYQATIGKDECLEEGIANASALENSHRKLKDAAIDSALSGYVADSPPGYRCGVKIRQDFDLMRDEFAEQNQRICFPHLQAKCADIWRTAPHMFNGIANIKSRVNYIIPRTSPMAARLPFRPLLPPSKLVKKLKEVAGLEFDRHGGNHDIYRTKHGKRIPIPRHARDLGRGLIRKILREAGLDMGLEEFLQQ